MKTILPCLLVCALTAANTADISGKWAGSFTPEGGDKGTAYVILKQNGTGITGSGGPDENNQWPGLHGTISGNKVSMEVKSPDDGTIYKCDLTLEGDRLKGDVVAKTTDGGSVKATLDLTRAAQ